MFRMTCAQICVRVYALRIFSSLITVLVVIISLGFLFSPTTASAFACQSNATGNWSVAGTWTNCNGTTPQTSDTIQILNGHTVTLNTSATVASTTIDVGGTLTEDGNGRTLTNASGWLNNGTFTANQSTVRFTGTQTIRGGTTFNNLEFYSSGTGRYFTIAAGTYATTTGTLILSGDDIIGLFTGNIDVQGNITITNTRSHANANGSATVTIKGSGDQTVTGNSTVGFGRLPNVVINKPSGNLTFANTITVGGNWTFTSIGSGSIISTGSTVAFIKSATITGSMTFNNLTFAPDGSGGAFTIAAGTFATTTNLTLSGSEVLTLNTGNIDVLGNLTLSNATAHPNANGSATITVIGTGDQVLTGASAPRLSRVPNFVINKSSGTLSLSGYLNVGGNFTYTAGTVDATTASSTVVMLLTSKTLDGEGTSATMAFDNLQLGAVGGENASITNNGILDINGSLNIITSSTLNNAGNHAIYVARNWTNGGAFTSGSGTVTFDGSADSIIITGGTGTTQDFASTTIAKTGSGVAQLSTNGMDIDNVLTVTSGTFNLNGQNLSTITTCNITGTIKLTGDETISCTPTLNAGSTVEYSATSGSRAVKSWDYSNASTTISGNGGTFTDSGTRTVGGNFTIAAGTYSAPSTLNVGGNWTKSGGTFTHNSGTVVLNGSNQSIAGSTTFYNLTKSESTDNTSDVTLTFEAGSTSTIDTGGLLTLTGLDDSDRLNLVSSVPSTAWYLNVDGGMLIDYVRVTDSDASGGSQILATNSLGVSGNVNWSLPGANQAPTVSSLAPALGDWTNDSTPAFTFTTADDDADTVAYELVVDDTSNFSSPVYRATSTYAVAGSVSTTTPVLPDAAGYYWRVMVGDGSATSSYSTANSGAIAFKLDTTAPTAGAITFNTVTATAITATTTGASDAASGLAATPFYYRNVTQDTYAAATIAAASFSSLTPNTTYNYEVGVLDLAGNWATTTADATTTLANSPATLTLTPGASSISASWGANSNPGDTEYYAENIEAGTNSGWITTTSWNSTGLTTETEYTINVKARSREGVETAVVDETTTTTLTPPPAETTPEPLSRSGSSRRNSSFSVVSGSSLKLNSPLYVGLRSPQVTALQQMLAQDPTIYPNPQITGYYGLLTKAAVARFQQKYGIITTPQTLGLAGPNTRAKLNAVYANGLSFVQPITTPVLPISQLQLLLRLLSR